MSGKAFLPALILSAVLSSCSFSSSASADISQIKTLGSEMPALAYRGSLDRTKTGVSAGGSYKDDSFWFQGRIEVDASSVTVQNRSAESEALETIDTSLYQKVLQADSSYLYQRTDQYYNDGKTEEGPFEITEEEYDEAAAGLAAYYQEALKSYQQMYALLSDSASEVTMVSSGGLSYWHLSLSEYDYPEIISEYYWLYGSDADGASYLSFINCKTTSFYSESQNETVSYKYEFFLS